MKKALSKKQKGGSSKSYKPMPNLMAKGNNKPITKGPTAPKPYKVVPNPVIKPKPNIVRPGADESSRKNVTLKKGGQTKSKKK